MAEADSLLARLIRHRVKFVIVGGFAAVAHGSALVTLEIGPGIEIVSSITVGSARGLKLKKGQPAYAVIKSSSVMIGTD